MPGPRFIDTDRLELCPPEEPDIDVLLEGVNNPAVRRYIGVFRTPYTEERYREELWPAEHEERGVSLVVVPRTGELAGDTVGSVQLYPLNDAQGYANFGVWFLPKAWGNGYALEAGAHLVDFGFTELRLHRISATTLAPNEAGATLCARLGFTHEGAAREAQFADGGYVDVDRHGLLADEWNGPEAVIEDGGSG